MHLEKSGKINFLEIQQLQSQFAFITMAAIHIMWSIHSQHAFSLP